MRRDRRRGRRAGPLLNDGRAQDQTTPWPEAPRPNGARRRTGQGVWTWPGRQDIAAQGAAVRSRRPGPPVVCPADGDRRDLVAGLGRQHRRRLARAVELGGAARGPARLLAGRGPQRVAAARREQIRAAAQRAGDVPRAPPLALADGTVLVTNAPHAVLARRAALVLARARWQIAHLVPRWTNAGPIDEWRSAAADRSRGEVSAKRTALVLPHGIRLVGCGLLRDRRRTQAAQPVRARVVCPAQAPGRVGALGAALTASRRGRAAGGRLGTRRGRPCLHHLLTDPALGLA